MSTISTTITSAVTLTTGGSYTSPLTITATGAVKNNSTSFAIYATTGIASAVITNDGQVIDKKGAGIYVKKSGTITNLGSAALISGGNYGIETGATKFSTVANQGTIQATSITGTGIFLKDGGFIGNTGSITGGTGAGASGIEIAAGGTIQNLGTTALISAGAYGVYVTGASAAIITNQGTISATRAAGYGIYLQNGTVSNAGTISGGKDAIVFAGTASNRLIISPGAVFSGNVKANALGDNALELAAGSITGTLTGLGSKYTGFSAFYVDAGATFVSPGNIRITKTETLSDSGSLAITNGYNFTNQGLVSITNSSPGLKSFDGTFINSGEITGGTFAAVYFEVTGTTTNADDSVFNSGVIIGGAGSVTASGTTQSGGIGLYLSQAFYVGAPESFNNTGIIQAGSLGGVGLKERSVALSNQGTIAGGSGVGAYVSYYAGQLTNTGLITATSGIAAVAAGQGSIINSALIESQSGIAVSLLEIGHLTNSGTIIVANGQYAVQTTGSFNGGYIGNAGLISGGSSYAVHAYKLVNSGTVIAGYGGTALLLNAVNGSNLNNSGSLLGGAGGGKGAVITALFSKGVSTNTGTIRGGTGSTNIGGGIGVYDEGGTFINNGIVLGGTGGTGAAGGTGGIGFVAATKVVDSLVYLINEGTIIGGAGESLGDGQYGPGGAGVSLSAYGFGYNTGIIIGGANGGTGLVSSTAVSFANYGTIRSPSGIGVDVTAARHYYHGQIGGGTITNAGLIAGATDAVLFENGTFSGFGGEKFPDLARLIFDPGARFQGLVVSQDPLSTLELNTGSTSGTITGLGTQFTGFGTLQVDHAARWLVNGGNNQAGNLIDNGTLEIASATTLNFAGALTGSGVVNIDANASVAVAGTLSGSGVVNIGANADLAVAGKIGTAATINLRGTDAVLELGTAPPAQNVIHGFTIGDTIDLAFATQINGAELIAGNLLVVESSDPANNITIALDPSANYSADGFNTSADTVTGGYDITVAVTPPPQTFIWAGATSAPFAAASSWQGDSGYPHARDTALFNLSAAGPYTVTGNGAVANLIVDDNAAFTGGINVSSGVTIGSTGSTAGTLTVSGSLFSPTLTLQNSRNALDITSGATVDAQGSLSDAGTVAIAVGGLLVTPTITLQNSQTLLNIASGATLAGAILSTAGGTIAAAGTVTGTVQIIGTTSATLEISPTTFLAGNVTASSSASDVLELAGSAATTFSGLGTQFSNFETLAFAPGANWTVVEPYQSIAALSEITGFTTGDTIILEGLDQVRTVGGANGTKYVPGVGLEISNGYQIIIPIGQDPSIIEPATYTANGKVTLIGGIDHITNFTPVNVTLDNLTFASGVTITPTGTVAPASGVGVTFEYNQALLNNGTILAANGAYAVSDFEAPFTNTGIIIGGTSAAVALRASPHFANNLTSYFYNAGLVEGGAGTTLNGTIRPGGNGVYGGFDTAADRFINAKSGTIIGGALNGNGVTLNRAAYFQNLGTIIAGSGSGDGFIGSAETFLNQGVIEASAGIGLYLAGYTNSFFNTGLIESNTGTAFESNFNGVNNGTIKALGGSIAAYQRNSYLRNNGLITGGTSTALLDRGNVNNAGTIIGAIGGNAVSLNFGNLINSGLLIGGSAGAAAVLSSNELGGNFLTNSGDIFGGTGAAGGTFGGVGGDGVILTSEPSFFNTGTIIGGTGGYAATGTAGTGGVGLYTSAFGSIINAGTIIGGAGGINAGGTMAMGGTGVLVSGLAARFTNQGTVIAGAGAYGVVILNNADATNSGTIQAASNYGVLFTGGTRFFQEAGTLITSGLISGQKDAVLFNNSLNNDVLIVDPGARFSGLVVGSTLSSDILEFGAGASVSGIGTEFLNFGNLSFLTGSAVIEGNSLGLANGEIISGFTAGNTIILDNFVVNTLDTTYVSGVGLELTDTAGNHITLDITGSFSTSSFIVVDPPGSTTIELAVCYLRGTRILTPAGERAIETLRIGDSVITKFGGYQKIKWIGRQSYARQFIRNNYEQIPVRIMAGALGPSIPARDLFVSPGHSMLIGGVLVLAKSLINGITIRQDECPERVDYFQLEFESHDCIMAEGAWSESYADTPNWRAKFDNASEFWALYPNHIAPAEQSLCAPRPVAGTELARALRAVIQRAAITACPGILRGFIDQITADEITGWAQDEAHPQLPVQLEILSAGRMIGHILACDHRPDLAAAGIGHGNAAFSFPLPAGCDLATIRIQRASDGATLPMTATQTEAA